MKWIGALLGFLYTHTFWGACWGYFLGYIIGSLFSSSAHIDVKMGSSGGDRVFNQPDNSHDRFIHALMVLAAHVIQADGKIMHSEMELVRNFLRASFGEPIVQQGNDILLKLFDYHKRYGDAMWNQQVQSSCQQMCHYMEYEQRLQLIAFLCEIAKADGHLDPTELQALRQLAVSLGAPAEVIDQMLHLGGVSLDDAYAVLGLTRDASDDEVKKAYRKMAMQYHPDRVATLGDDVKAAATKKFQEINEAKERIFKERGL